MIKINKQLVDEVSQKAKTVPRKRMNHNFHLVPEEPMNRMLNALEPGTYVRPHKHENPDKKEAFLILQGSILVVSFDNNGNITDHFILNHGSGNFGLEIPPRTYHTLICLEAGSVIYELKEGPYDVSTDKHFAPWSPEEGSSECGTYIQSLLTQLKLDRSEEPTY